MKVKNRRLEAIRLIISSQQLGCQDDLLNALKKEGFNLTQATLSRDLKQLKVAKASTLNGDYIYVLPNETMYKRVPKVSTVREMMQVPGFLSINFSSKPARVTPAPSPGALTAATFPQSWVLLLATTTSSSLSKKDSPIRKLLMR